LGTFGDPSYKYVAINSYLHTDSEANEASLRWEQGEALTWIGVTAQLYTSVRDMPMRSELYFQKVTALKGETFGLLGRTGNDESEQLLAQETYMVKASEYTYVGKKQNNSRGEVIGRTLYLRATKTERADFHEVYSIMKLLEALGGLYTSLSFVLFIPLVITSKLLRYGGGLLLMVCHRDNVLDPAENGVHASTEAQVVMSKNMEEGCEGSPDPRAAASLNGNVEVASASHDAEVSRALHNVEGKFMEL